VNGVPLDRWIRQDTRRGKLSEFARGMHLWEVPVKQVAGVRRGLLSAGLILEPEEDDYDPENPVMTPEESLAFIFRHYGASPGDLIILDGTGKEVPTAEVKKIVQRGRKTLSKRLRELEGQ
jgi:hypothetical protein